MILVEEVEKRLTNMKCWVLLEIVFEAVGISAVCCTKVQSSHDIFLSFLTHWCICRRILNPGHLLSINPNKSSGTSKRVHFQF